MTFNSLFPTESIWWGALACALCATANAQSQPQPQSSASAGSAESLQKVVITGNSDDRRTATAAKTVIQHDDLVKYGASTVADALKNVPGVTISGNASGAPEIKIGGLGMGYTQILLNGEPLPRNFSIDSLSPNLVERIEITRSASAEFSTQAIAGTINIILRQRATAASRNIGVNVSEENGRPALHMDAQVADRFDMLSYSMSVSALDERFASYPWATLSSASLLDHQQDGTTTSTRAQSSDASSISFTGKLTYRKSALGQITLEMFARRRYVSEFNQETNQAISGPLLLYPSDTLTYTRGMSQLRPRLGFSHEFEDGAKVEAKLGYNYDRRQSHAHLTAFDAGGSALLDRTVVGPSLERQLTTTGKYTLAYVADRTTAFGWSIDGTDRRDSRQQDDVTAPGIVPIDLEEKFDTRVARIAMYVQEEWSLPDQSSLYLGARSEQIRTSSTGSTVDSYANVARVLSPIAQLLWNANKSGDEQYRVSLARTYRAPLPTDLAPRRYWSISNSATEPDSIGNPRLLPEVAWAFDLSGTWTFSKMAEFSANLNYRQIKDVIVKTVWFDGTRWVASPTNFGDATSFSVGGEGTIDFGLLSPTLSGLKAKGNLNLNHSRISRLSGNYPSLPGQNPASGSFGLEGSAPHLMQASYGASFSFQSCARYARSDHLVVVSDCARGLDVFALVHLSKDSTVKLTVKNLFSRADKTETYYSDDESSRQSLTVFPTYRVIGLEWRTRL